MVRALGRGTLLVPVASNCCWSCDVGKFVAKCLSGWVDESTHISPLGGYLCLGERNLLDLSIPEKLSWLLPWDSIKLWFDDWMSNYLVKIFMGIVWKTICIHATTCRLLSFCLCQFRLFRWDLLSRESAWIDLWEKTVTEAPRSGSFSLTDCSFMSETPMSTWSSANGWKLFFQSCAALSKSQQMV